MNISYSELKRYWKCPEQYQRHQGTPVPDSLSSVIGTSIQAGVEVFYRDRLWQNVEPGVVVSILASVIRETYERLAPLVPLLDRDAYADGRKAVIASIWPILQSAAAEKLISTRYYVEHEMTMPVGSHIVHGRVDLLIWRGDDPYPTVIDGKAGATLGRYVDLDQLRLYEEMARLTFGGVMAVGFWWYRHGVVQWKPLAGRAARRSLYKKIEEALTNIDEDHFAATPSATACRYCPFRLTCIHGQLALQESTNATPAPPAGDLREMTLGD